MKIVLASGSPYRQALLRKTGLSFDVYPADIDETPRPGEQAAGYVKRLAEEKADKVAAGLREREALVIGCDQVCVLEGRLLGKPGTHAAAFRQLRDCSGKTVDFLTGLALVDCRSAHRQIQVEPFQVRFRELEDAEILRYLELDAPYDCAGSFKAESAGICLFEAMHGRDFNALVGLPLIALLDMLRNVGVNPLLPAPESLD